MTLRNFYRILFIKIKIFILLNVTTYYYILNLKSYLHLQEIQQKDFAANVITCVR